MSWWLILLAVSLVQTTSSNDEELRKTKLSITPVTDGEYVCAESRPINRTVLLHLHLASRDQAAWLMDVKVNILCQSYKKILF